MREASTLERELFIRYGSAASEAMFDYPCNFFQIPDCLGYISYRVEFKCAIIIGDPICPISELEALTYAFHQYCHGAGLKIIYVIVSEKFARFVQQYCPILIEVCEELIFDPQLNQIFKSNRLHHRVEKAIQHGLTFHEYIPFDNEIENGIAELSNKWLKGKKGLGLHLGHLNFFETHLGKRWFYVKDGNTITSMAMLSQIGSQKGWLLKFFITDPSAFHDTSEFMMASVLTLLKKENCSFLTKGSQPVDYLSEINGLKYSAPFVKFVYKMVSIIFKFKKRKEYWKRYQSKKERSYLLLSSSNIGISEIRALMKVFKMHY